MLSPHEFSTLMLLKNAPDQVEPERSELGTLLRLDLIALESSEHQHPRPRVTESGDLILKAMSRH